MKRLVFLFLLLSCVSANAQSSTRPQAQAVASCGTRSLTAGVYYPVTQDLTGTLCTGSGGGGGGTAVTIADGADVTQGAKADAVCGSATGTCTEIALLKYLNTAATSSIPAGSAIIGQVGIDQTTPGTTNLVSLSPETTKVIGTVNQGTSPWVVSGPAPSSSSAIGITPIVSGSAEATHVFKASPGNAYSVYATNLTATAGFLLVLNATSAPADGAVTPLACAPLAPNGVASINYAPSPPGVFSTGITAVVTSAVTCFTKTTGVITAFISGSVQ